MAFTLGVMVPFGAATSAPGDNLRDRYSTQMALLVDLGAKLGPSFYLGAYLGLSLGSEGADTRVEKACDDDGNGNRVGCSSSTLRAGLALRYSFAPAARANPWIGYGFGWTQAEQSIDDELNNRRESTSVSGLELARLALGVDFRLSHAFGLGPELVGAFGRYSSTTTEVDGVQSSSHDIKDTAIHTWLTLGLRLVLFP
jgi:hypothetical protein